MTTFECRTCGSSWSMGPTRDHKIGARCHNCAAVGNAILNARVAELEAQLYDAEHTAYVNKLVRRERERIIALLISEYFPYALCLPTSEDGDWEPVMEDEIRAALKP